VIKYIGSKRALLPWILDVVDAIQVAVPLKTAADPFSGSSRVAHALKSQGLRVVASDINAYAHILATALVEADANEYPESRIIPILEQLAALPPVEGYFTRTFCREARFFQPKNGQRVDAIRAAIDDYSEGDPILRSILLTSLILAADRVDSTTGVHMAYLKKWAPRAHKDLELRPPALLPGSGKAYQRDILEFAAELDVDLVYLDPPYNQHAYLSNYHIWETLVCDDDPEAYGIARKRTDCRTRKSPFNSKRKARAAMEHVIASLNTPVVVLSFSNEGVFSRSEIEDLLGTRGPVTTLCKEHRRYVGSRIGIYNPAGDKVGAISHTENTEYLYVMSADRGVHIALADRFNPQKADRTSAELR